MEEQALAKGSPKMEEITKVVVSQEMEAYRLRNLPATLQIGFRVMGPSAYATSSILLLNQN